jgi:hypothetical protein
MIFFISNCINLKLHSNRITISDLPFGSWRLNKTFGANLSARLSTVEAIFRFFTVPKNVWCRAARCHYFRRTPQQMFASANYKIWWENSRRRLCGSKIQDLTEIREFLCVFHIPSSA